MKQKFIFEARIEQSMERKFEAKISQMLYEIRVTKKFSIEKIAQK
jgi:hypothetical protein